MSMPSWMMERIGLTKPVKKCADTPEVASVFPKEIVAERPVVQEKMVSVIMPTAEKVDIEPPKETDFAETLRNAIRTRGRKKTKNIKSK